MDGDFRNFVNRPDMRSEEPNEVISVDTVLDFFQPQNSGLNQYDERNALAELGGFSTASKQKSDFNTFLDFVNNKYNPYPVINNEKKIILGPKDLMRLSRMEKIVLRHLFVELGL